MDEKVYLDKLASIEAISNDVVITPDMPVATALQEAEDLEAWCISDKEALEKSGLDWKLVDDLPLRTGACRYIQSQWQKDFRSQEEAQREWAVQSVFAYNLRDETLHHFFHAYHKFDVLTGKVQRIAEGYGNADMLQDLSDLSALGKANPQPLQLINFDLAQLDTAATLSEDMAKLLAKANGMKMEDNQLKLLRDKAYTYMKEAVDEIRRHGQYVFWRNEDRKKGYVSKYNRKRNSVKPSKQEVKA
jgi:hypothetical protein